MLFNIYILNEILVCSKNVSCLRGIFLEMNSCGSSQFEVNERFPGL